MPLPDELNTRKVELLAGSAADFEGQVLATAHLDRKIVVNTSNRPRSVMDLKELEWQEVIDRWGMLDEAGNGGGMMVLSVAPGWEIEVRGNWGRILDRCCGERASYIYGSGNVDDGATFFLNCRYTIIHHYQDPSDRTLRIVSAAANNVIFREFGRVFAGDPDYQGRLEKFDGAAEAWMNREYPEWRDPFAYWDAP